MKFICYTDGSYSRKYDKGAYAFVIISENKDIIKQAKPILNSTSQISELTAVVECLKTLSNIVQSSSHKIDIDIISDSKYCVTGLNEWIYSWIDNYWITSSNKVVANKELWQEAYNLKQLFKSVNMIWVKGHSGNEYNEMVDKMCFALTRQD